MPKPRHGSISRKTKETAIDIRLNLDGKGASSISTGIPFLDHMLTTLAKHGSFDLTLKGRGDLEIDQHHTNEDVGIALGQSFTKALGNKKGIRRFGFFGAPMDEALVRTTLDISGRPSFLLLKDRKVKLSEVASYSLHDACEFLRGFIQHAGINMVVEVVSGEDSHHVIEAVFKSMAKALDSATQIDKRIQGIPSTKGVL